MLRNHAILPATPRREPERHGTSGPHALDRGPEGEPLGFELVSSDGVPSLDTMHDRLQMNLLIELTHLLMADRGQVHYFAAGDTFLYYSVEQARFIADNVPAFGERPSAEYRALLGPDFFYVADAPWRKDRQMWITWEEGNRYPQVVVELASPSTVKTDRTVKKDRYERLFKTAEYYIYRPTSDQVEAYHMGAGARYRSAERTPALPDADTASERWIWSEELEVWLGLWKGTFTRYDNLWLRFYDTEGQLILTQHERTEMESARADKAELGVKAQTARAQAAERANKTAKAQAETEKARAEAEKARAEAEKARAEAAETEIQRLRALLAGQSNPRD